MAIATSGLWDDDASPLPDLPVRRTSGFLGWLVVGVAVVSAFAVLSIGGSLARVLV
ncbi:hypothetical protein [Cellulosimicrobium marinum]|uniref:hypothetical protein n=1 Tax=Cellulosimicrobium marinum TaxID=1638992 RepID=UPI001E3AF21C|nr:hypothetical protein [Cellulosimicrobium marinum]